MKNHFRILISVVTAIVLLAVIGFAFVWHNAQGNEISNAQQETEISNALKDAKAIFAIFEGQQMNIHISSLNGEGRQLLLSQKINEPATRSRPFSILDAKVSPDGQWIAYKFSDAAVGAEHDAYAVYLVDIYGKNKKKIISRTSQFIWSPDSSKILYAGYKPPARNDGFSEAPMYGPGAEWHTFSLINQEDSILKTQKFDFNSAEIWLDNSHILFSSLSAYGGIEPKLYIFNIGQGTAKEIEIDAGQIGDISRSPTGVRHVLSTLPERYGAEYSCDFYEFNSDGMLGDRFIASPDYDCKGMAWADDDFLYYGKGTGPRGKIDPKDTGDSGYYILASVYKYDFAKKRERPFLVSDGKWIYRFMGAGKTAVMVSNESNNRMPGYILEAYSLNGQKIGSLYAGEKEPLFIGWIE
jgi:hypothetical protein